MLDSVRHYIEVLAAHTPLHLQHCSPYSDHYAALCGPSLASHSVPRRYPKWSVPDSASGAQVSQLFSKQQHAAITAHRHHFPLPFGEWSVIVGRRAQMISGLPPTLPCIATTKRKTCVTPPRSSDMRLMLMHALPQWPAVAMLHLHQLPPRHTTARAVPASLPQAFMLHTAPYHMNKHLRAPSDPCRSLAPCNPHPLEL